MTIEKTTQGIRISDIVGYSRMSRHYIGYTKAQALRKWKTELDQLIKNIHI